MAHSCFGVCSVFFPPKSSSLLFMEHWDALAWVSWVWSHQEGSSFPITIASVKFSRLFQAEDDFLERNFSSGGTAYLFDLQEVDLSCSINGSRPLVLGGSAK